MVNRYKKRMPASNGNGTPIEDRIKAKWKTINSLQNRTKAEGCNKRTE